VERLAHWVVRLRWLVIVVFLAVAVFMGARLKDVVVDAEVKSQLPVDMASRVNLDRIEDLFGGTDMMMVMLEADDVLAGDTLKRVKGMSKKIERLKEVDRVLSLFTLKDIRSESGEMIVDPAVKRIPGTDEKREKLRQALKDNDMVYGNVVSEDFTATAIILFKKIEWSDDELLASLEEVVAEVPGPEKVVFGGMPYMRVLLGQDIQHDLRTFLPLGLGIALLFLFISFRQVRGVLLPFSVVVLSIVVGMGLIPLLGWKIQMVTIILPVIMIAIANDYGIHLMAAYQEHNQPDSGLDRKDLARRVAATLGKPIIATGITTIAGMMCLMAHIIVPAEQLGILASVAVAYALLASLMFIPAVLSFLPRAKPVLAARNLDQGSRLERSLLRTAQGVTRHPGAVTLVIFGVAAVVAVGMVWLRVDTNIVNYYEKGAPVPESTEMVNRHFGGANAISVVATGDIKDPEVMGRIDGLEKALAALPLVGETTSISRLVRKMNRVMNDDDPKEDRIPDSRDAIAQYFLLYSMSGDPEDFDRLVDFPYEHALVTARIETTSSGEIKDIVEFTEDYVEREGGGTFTTIGGFAAVLSELVDAVVNGQVISLSLSLVLVGLMVGILFRSVVAGLLCVIPLGLSMVLLFGLMGFLGIELNIPVAMLSSMMIGVGVDYTIHFLWRYRSERRHGKDPVPAILTTLTTTGRGIVINALSVIVGFSAMFASAFMPVKFFGFLVVVSIGTCLVGALVLLPALSLLLKPRFLEPERSGS